MDEGLLYPLPDGVNEHEAVAVVHSALTACIGLVREAAIQAGETLLINGGSGNVGSAALQVAHYFGARVIVTAGSTEKIRRCLELGADRAVNYKTEDVAAAIRDFAPQGVDVYWDTTREPDFERSVPLLKHRGRIILMAGLNAHPPSPWERSIPKTARCTALQSPMRPRKSFVTLRTRSIGCWQPAR